VLSEAQLVERSAADAARSDHAFERAVDKIFARIEAEHDRGATIDVLALSGGGDYGAFGAGFLVGWGSAPEGRPDFDAVTGVSTGALLAPFAFIGTDEACLEVEEFYRNPKKDWVRRRGVLFFLPSHPSFAELPGLERDLRRAIGREFMDRMAAESREGRLLAVSATDLDLGRQKFWDLGAEAETVSDEAGVDRVQRILLASAAIPAVFPPVEIDGGLYADGGVTANVLLRLEVEDPRSFIPRWRAEHPGEPIPKIRYWIIINNQLHQQPRSVQLRWPAVVGPSLATAIRSATITEVRWLAAQADYVNAVYGAGIEVRVVAIPDEWRPPVAGDFKRETMVSLAELGRRMGADPGSWRVWASREQSRSRAALRASDEPGAWPRFGDGTRQGMREHHWSDPTPSSAGR